MNDPTRDPASDPGGPDDASIAEEQGAHLRRILVGFAIVVVLLPLAGLGNAFGWLLLPLLAVGAWTFREGMRLRRSVRRHGAMRRPR